MATPALPSLPTISSGSTGTATDSTGSVTGSATYSCTGTTWADNPTAKTCSAVTTPSGYITSCTPACSPEYIGSCYGGGLSPSAAGSCTDYANPSYTDPCFDRDSGSTVDQDYTWECGCGYTLLSCSGMPERPECGSSSGACSVGTQSLSPSCSATESPGSTGNIEWRCGGTFEKGRSRDLFDGKLIVWVCLPDNVPPP